MLQSVKYSGKQLDVEMIQKLQFKLPVQVYVYATDSMEYLHCYLCRFHLQERQSRL